MSSASLAYAARVLVLIGGILLVLFSALSLLELALELVSIISFRSPLEGLSIPGREFGIIALILGIISIIGARYVNRIEWAIVLLVMGYVAGGLGGLLVLVGGILGLVSALLKKK